MIENNKQRERSFQFENFNGICVLKQDSRTKGLLRTSLPNSKVKKSLTLIPTVTSHFSCWHLTSFKTQPWNSQLSPTHLCLSHIALLLCQAFLILPFRPSFAQFIPPQLQTPTFPLQIKSTYIFRPTSTSNLLPPRSWSSPPGRSTPVSLLLVPGDYPIPTCFFSARQCSVFQEHVEHFWALKRCLINSCWLNDVIPRKADALWCFHYLQLENPIEDSPLQSNPLKTSSFILLWAHLSFVKVLHLSSICNPHSSDYSQHPLNSLLFSKKQSPQIHTLGMQWAVQWHSPKPSWCNCFPVSLLRCSLTIVLYLPRWLCLKLYRKNEYDCFTFHTSQSTTMGFKALVDGSQGF